LEEPPKGVVFILTAADSGDVLETIRSRCVTMPLLPLSEEICVGHISARYPDFDADRISELCMMYSGRLGYVKKALESPERLAATQSAKRFCEAAITRDKLAMMEELDCAANREDMKNLLFDTVMCLKQALYSGGKNGQIIDRILAAVHGALQDIEKYVNIKLLAANLIVSIVV
jgi:DNA polymerase-3 subunit delta'